MFSCFLTFERMSGSTSTETYALFSLLGLLVLNALAYWIRRVKRSSCWCLNVEMKGSEEVSEEGSEEIDPQIVEEGKKEV